MNVRPVTSGLRAAMHTPIYTMHRYFARRPHNVIGYLIDHYIQNNQGALVFDPFAGGGVVVLEALARGHYVIAYDTSDLACYIIEEQVSAADAHLEKLGRFVEALLAETVEVLGSCYRVCDQEIYWICWNTVTECPFCHGSTELSQRTARGTATYKCVNCQRHFRPRRVNMNRAVPGEICLMGEGSMATGTIISPRTVHFSQEEIEAHYRRALQALENEGLGAYLRPVTPIGDCNLQRESALHKKGLFFYEQFIPTMTRGVIGFIGTKIMTSGLSDVDKRRLMFVLSSSLRYISRFSTLNKGWRGEYRPLEWAKSNFWTPYSYVEVNAILAFWERWHAYERGVKDGQKRMHGRTLKRGAVHEVVAREATHAIVKGCSEEAPIPDSSIDLILTDPPYGSNLHYGELSGFWTCWLSKFLSDISPTVDRRREAVPARKKGYPDWKTYRQYEDILASVFKTCYRVLKDEHYCVVTFNNREPEAWLAFLRSVKRAGFILPDGGVVYQDGVEAYKRTIDLRRDGAIHGDFIYSFVKSTNSTQQNRALNWKEAVDKVIRDHCYSRVPISNSDLYALINSSVLPLIYRAIDLGADREEDSLADFTTVNLERIIQQHLTREGSLWYPR